MDEIAKNFSVKFEKIQNWYKTHRRNDMKRGCMKYQVNFYKQFSR